VKNLEINFRWIILNFFLGFLEYQKWNREEHLRGVPHNIKGTHESKHRLYLSSRNIPMLLEQKQRKDSGNPLSSNSCRKLATFFLRIKPAMRVLILSNRELRRLQKAVNRHESWKDILDN
jgi:hypothetical protein